MYLKQCNFINHQILYFHIHFAGCSWAYHIASYPQLGHINTQVVEQANSSIEDKGIIIIHEQRKLYDTL